MSRDWARLGSALKAAREGRHLRQEDVAEKLGLTRGAIANIEGGKSARLTRTVRDYARLVGWAEGSVEAVLDGGAPKAAEADQRTANAAPDLSTRVLSALAEGELIGSRVLHTQGPSGEITATLVVRGEGDIDAEGIRQELIAWLSSGPELRTTSGEITSDDPSSSGA